MAFAGERTPVDDPLARGVIAGLTLEHTRGDIVRAILEGIGLAVADLLAARFTDSDTGRDAFDE